MGLLSGPPGFLRLTLRHTLRRQYHISRPLWSDSIDGKSAPAGSPEPSSRAPMIYPEPSSSEHHDLASFLDYAERVQLSETSTVFVGTRYEYRAAASLADYGFSLRRTGQAGDRGIDLLGTWSVPSAPHPLRVLVQCKATKKATPSWIRELEGAFAGAPPGWRGTSVLGLLVTDMHATNGIRKALVDSHWPMGFIFLSRKGEVLQMLWNYKAGEQGLTGMGVSKRYSLAQDAETLDHKVLLTWQGRQLPLIQSASVTSLNETDSN